MSVGNMRSFCEKHIIVLLVQLVLVLSQEISTGSVENETWEPTNFQKLLRSLQNPPWINPVSSWIEKVTSHCGNDLRILFKSADAGEMWALQMLDATSKIPSGILMGNIIDLGAYDECVGVEGQANPANIQGQHCLVSLSIPPKSVRNPLPILCLQRSSIFNPTARVNLSLTFSACLPSSCDVEDVAGFVDASIQSRSEFAELDVRVAQVKCSSLESVNYLNTGIILTIFFFVVLAGILLSCTVCDFVVKARPENASPTLKTLAKFSIYTNAIQLMSTKVNTGSIPSINGMRCLSIFSIILCHRGFVEVLRPSVNLSYVLEIKQSFATSAILTLLHGVDTLFIISGFLVTYLFLKKMHSGKKFNILKFYFHRYIRLTPCLAILILIMNTASPIFKSGPIWQSLLGDLTSFCEKNWWTNLLYIQNFVNREEMCAAHTWQLAVDMQFYLLSPILLNPLFHRPKLGLTILGVLLIASLITPAIQVFIHNYVFLFNMNKPMEESYTDFFHSYTMTYNRALPYLIGILLGYDVISNKRHITKLQCAVNWTLTCVFIAFCYWNSFFLQPNADTYDAVSEATRVSFARLGWSLAVAWVLYACIQGYGGPVTRFLSLPIFVPLSRMSYCIFLVHIVLQLLVTGIKRTAEFVVPYSALHLVCGDLAMSIVAAFMLNICVETPVLILEKVIQAKQPIATICRTSTNNNGELATMNGDYSDSRKSQVDSDPDVRLRTPWRGRLDCTER